MASGQKFLFKRKQTLHLKSHYIFWEEALRFRLLWMRIVFKFSRKFPQKNKFIFPVKQLSTATWLSNSCEIFSLSIKVSCFTKKLTKIIGTHKNGKIPPPSQAPLECPFVKHSHQKQSETTLCIPIDWLKYNSTIAIASSLRDLDVDSFSSTRRVLFQRWIFFETKFFTSKNQAGLAYFKNLNRAETENLIEFYILILISHPFLTTSWKVLFAFSDLVEGNIHRH